MARPLEKVPVTFEIELKAPPIECARRDPAPCMIPTPNYAGPYTKPWAGFYLNYLTPVDMFLNRPIGFPMMFKLPKTL